MTASLKRVVALGLTAALTGCGLIAGFGDKPQLGEVGVDGGTSNPTLDATALGDASIASEDAPSGATPDGGVPPTGEAGGCPGNETACTSGCTDTATDSKNCGVCGRACGATYACHGGVCDDAVVALAAGSHHACAALAGGALYCWGNNDLGQVGNGTSGAIVTTPALIARDDTQATVANPTQLALGDDFSCALFTGGIMRCWGTDFYGQLSDGQFSGETNDGGAVFRTVPHAAHQSPGIQNAQVYSYTSLAIGSSADHGCATATDGTDLCWGDNDEGAVGVDGGAVPQGCGQGGDTSCYPFPGLVPGVTNARQIAAGGDHSCAVDPNGAVLCWGINGDGQLGLGDYGIGSPHAAGPIALDAGAAQGIAASPSSTCALLADGSVWCWGLNSSSQLGHDAGPGADGNCCLNSFCGFMACNGSPQKVSGLGVATSVAMGCSHTCALLNDGTVFCWGANDKGQLGTGDNVGAGYPRKVSGLSSVKGISLGCDTSCAWKSDGTAWCWGLNADGELANANPTNASVPTQITLP